MKFVPDEIRQELQRQRPIQVRVGPEGFDLDGTIAKELTGRVYEATLTRKLFVDRKLQCRSPDGTRASDGITECAACDHRLATCQPILKIRVVLSDGRHCAIDLAASSARNLIQLDDQLDRTDIPLPARHLRLTLVHHERWQEIQFAVATSATS